MGPLFLLSFVSATLASPQAHQYLNRRQNIPAALPEGWSSQGCYTDEPGARTLTGASYSSGDAMTVESCISFCSDANFPLAGVEFSRECFCGYAVQSPGAPTGLSECSYACTGDSAQSCGGAGRLNLFASGASAPSVPQTVAEDWDYQGCYTDSVSDRTLSHSHHVDGGITIESCVAFCSTNGFSFAGLEFGDECFCGNSIGASTKKSDSECAMVCSGNLAEFCGGRDRLTLYSTGDAEEPPEEPPTPTCISTNVARFNPLAVFKTPPPAGPLSRPIGMINVNTVPHVSYGLLSSAGSGGWLYYALQNGAIYPKTTIPFPAPVSFSVVPGYSPIFVSTQIPPPAYSGFCSMANPSGGPPLLAANLRPDLWSLCSNTTAGGRNDLVYSPQANHPHYNLATCLAVNIHMVPA
ncbi:WSC domain-containing protein [Pleurotus pulmonarius]|nr:WSC domain-containing protein 2 [Pleurotus pulmonarius]KAF4601313.1 WSC domain-containing protein 2 [Pleurotus pulmonarius]